MQFAIDIPHFGALSDPLLVAELAHEAEEMGWDGFFVWDHINYKLPDLPQAMAIADPWIQMSAIALRTSRIKLGPMVTPLARRRPWKVARETVTLDHLSGGRLIFGIGLGTDRSGEYSIFGETTDARAHGELLDEGLEVLTKLWSGEKFSYAGKHYQLSQAQFLPKPLQQPRIPIWVAGHWPHKKPLRRAAKFDGIFPLMRERALTPNDFREILGYVREQRTQDTPFDVVAGGLTSGTDKARDAAQVASFAEAGATWWLECYLPQHTLEQVRQRIRQGPPQF
ncbi:LLM class flavin-dependent oxidoreductase [Ktedonosporobacter rubrisoli]|uniref:LLM class flavin-dependent oxidoreductase n=1 Tax=Ktedonosporobacter rubrisoli TaxID=2509675 RepID=A0A4P6JNF8_KTERU|nr:LLM class flavin-dependent oxidoreductase [Ktedonosporobacter rubrisoli]QBD76703.1 LLM class flavin-dependent oxidoreductase [Ktedonosporobacter rubrisoli]